MVEIADITFRRRERLCFARREVILTNINFSEEDKATFAHERYHHHHPRVRRKMDVLWLKSQGIPHNQIATLAGISINVVTAYLKEFEAGGSERLTLLNFNKPQSEMENHKAKLKEYFKENPPATIKEAMGAIERLTGLKRSEPQIRKFLINLGMKHRKLGMVPAKADPQKQADFFKTSWHLA